MAKPGKKLKDRVWHRDRGLCFYCGCFLKRAAKERTLDHVIPKCKEGTSNRMWNLVIACRSCNSEKNDTDPTSEQLAVIMERKRWGETHLALCKAIGRAGEAGSHDEVKTLLSLREAVWAAIHRPRIDNEMTSCQFDVN